MMPNDSPCVPRSVLPPLRPLEHSPDELSREASRRSRGMLDDLVDVHTHLFPPGFFRAVCDWFDAHAWRIRFRGDAEAALEELSLAGVKTAVALVYAHKPGAARALNAFLAELCRAHPNVVGVGTVLPGEPDARDIVREAVSVHRLRGIKLHCHVQHVAIDDPRVLAVLEECENLGLPAVVHAGREPSTKGYGIDVHAICSVSRTETVLRRCPRLRLVIPHIGIDEIDRYLALLDEHENLYLDTAMVCADYFDEAPPYPALERMSHRIMYGSDFPITPYDVDREVRVLARRIVSDEAFERIMRGTAREFWQLG
jgi:predicted TIM-barrel fold metal-dependent hydrolase